MKYKRILLKLSGEALMGDDQYGLNHNRLEQYANEIKAVVDQGLQVGIVIGGGNIFRGIQNSNHSIDRTHGDYMGMLATVINGMAIQAYLEKLDIPTKLLSGIPVDPVAESMSGSYAIQYLEDDHVIIISGGTGNPYFTTDTASALRAMEIKADAIFKGTRVDGVYTADPEKDPDATKYDVLSFDEAIEKGLKVMDQTAFTLCRENNIPIVVFNMNVVGNLLRIVKGEQVGTIVS
ncbi:MAG: UMP kinase [Bacteroidota bacterium]|nr:UMP kinase [Bacteroidota bacterium]